MNKYLILFVIIACIGCTGENLNEITLRSFIGALNRNEISDIDTLLTVDFKYVSDSETKDKRQYIEDATKQDTTYKIEIVKVSESGNVLKVKSNLTNYAIRTLEMKPMVREREYHFDENHKIKAIYLVNFHSLPEHQNFDKYFGVWAVLYYPEMANSLKAKMANNEDYFEERHLLLLKLKHDGLQMLDSARIFYENQLKAKEEEQRKINSLPAAPLNNVVFTKISNTVSSISVSNGVKYSDANPILKKQILSEAFVKNGYNYSKTLHKVSDSGFSIYDYNYILILLSPSTDLPSNVTREEIYTEQELADVNQIKRIIESHK